MLRRKSAAALVFCVLSHACSCGFDPGLISEGSSIRKLQADNLESEIEWPAYPSEQQLQQEDRDRNQWITDTPHQPGDDLRQALDKAAFPSSTSKGLVILTSGSKFAFDHLLPRWLDSLKHTRDGDLTRHAVVGALGQPALEFCKKSNAHHQHHCAAVSWPGPETQYHFGDDWYVAATLSKLELITNVLSLDYSLFWVDTDIVMFASPMQYLEDLAVDMAVGLERCDVVANFSSGFPGPFNFNTGTILLKATAAGRRFVRSWLGFQKRHLLYWTDADFDRSDGMQRRSDQVTLNNYALPNLVSDTPDRPHYLRIQGLSHQHFPNFCGGPCGCQGTQSIKPPQFIRFENQQGHLMSGRLVCPRHTVDDFFTFHFPCTWSTAEKAALLDTYQAMADRMYPKPAEGHAASSD
ncbi:hypothetical protein WJX73_007658 [Symbiochloris irregularis]|uniref:Nucleotide-diphospho-sugar transferase domain-containing protein n=1 Tax=Symbiochloris irregularis TaxID=706552 RepID=A0AAW1PVK9_9CHLO